MVSCAHVLRYYSLKDEVTVQCDASGTGLGACLTQNGQPVAYASRALTKTEIQYAQIEKELLAIVFACEHFDAYLYGRDLVTVESDHKPLENIVRKPLINAPQRLQRMLLRLQRYSLKVTYRKGKEMFLADTLSRAHSNCSDISQLEEPVFENIDHKELLPVSHERWEQITKASRDDHVLQVLRETIRNGWPNQRQQVPHCVRPYFDFCDELTIQGDLVFKGMRLVVPSALRTELIRTTHSTHIGMEGCLRRMRECLFWPRMSTEVKEWISKCDTCAAYRNNQPKEPFLQQDGNVLRPWSKVAADVCEIHGRNLLVVVDYYSNFIEVKKLTSLTTQSTVHALGDIFARFGVPDLLFTDNATNFSSAEFAAFAKKWRFNHMTSSPGYAQSNGKAENAIQTIKRLFNKCRDTGESEFVALLDWRNTPTEGVGSSPAQRLMGRRCKTLLPMAGELLLPRTGELDEEKKKLVDRKKKQAFYYNKGAKPLREIKPHQAIRVKLPGERRWSRGMCKGKVAPRSYDVEVENHVYRRNRRHLLDIGEPIQMENIPSEEHGEQEDNSESGVPRAAETEMPNQPVQELPRRSSRVRKQTEFFQSM